MSYVSPINLNPIYTPHPWVGVVDFVGRNTAPVIVLVCFPLKDDSINDAALERSKMAKMVSSDIEWSDVGSFDILSEMLPQKVDEKIPAINNLDHDYSVMLDANGTQLQTVGDHWKLSQALPKSTRDKLDRRGTCLACHKEMPDRDPAVSLLVHTAKYAGIKVDNQMHHILMHKSLLMTAWVQVVGGLLLVFGILNWWVRRK